MELYEAKSKAAIYIRLSVEDENKIDESESIKNQRLILTQYAKSQGWEIYKIYCDEDFSGLDRDRPEFQQMLIDAKKGLFNIILCKSQSRFTRDLEVAEKYINRLFYLWNIRFISLTDNVDTFNKGGKKARQINSLINEWYCEDLSESVKAVFKNKMQRGEFIGSFAPYGYKKSEDNKNRLEIDEEVSHVIEEIFRLYLKGNGFRKIAESLTAKGIMPPTLYKLSKGTAFFNPNYTTSMGELWSASTIRNILKNPVYIGITVQGKTKKLSYKSKKIVNVDKAEQIKVTNTHRAIIEEDIFYKVQEMLKNSTLKTNDTEITSALRGKVFCGLCGSLCQRGSLNREKTGFYYRCSLKYKSRGEKCNNSGVLSLDIENEVFKRLKEFKNMYIGENEKHYIEEIEPIKEEMTAINTNNSLNELDNRLLRLYEDYSQGILEKEEFIVLKGKISEEKQALKQELDKTKARKVKALKTNEAINSLNSAEKLFQGDKPSYELINAYIDKIVVEGKEGDKKRVVIIWRI